MLSTFFQKDQLIVYRIIYENGFYFVVFVTLRWCRYDVLDYYFLYFKTKTIIFYKKETSVTK